MIRFIDQKLNINGSSRPWSEDLPLREPNTDVRHHRCIFLFASGCNYNKGKLQLITAVFYV